MRRVLYITARADYGGGPEHLFQLIKGLHNRGYKIFVAAPKDEPYWHKYSSIIGQTSLFEIPHRRFSIFKVFQLIQFIRANNIEFVHSHGKGAGLYSRIIRMLYPSVKIIHTLHGVHYQEYGRLTKILYFYLERFLSTFTDKFINVSMGEQQQALKLGFYQRNRSVVIHNGVNIERNVLHNRNIIGLSDQDFVVVNISRFDYQKNIKMIIQIAEKLIKKTRIKFLLVGDGPDKAELEKYAKDNGLNNIIFAGFQADVSHFLNKADIYLSTSRWEGLPLAIIESLAVGTPVIASDVVGNNEAVEHEISGLLFPLDRLDIAVEYILYMFIDDRIRASYSDRALKAYNKHFRLDKMISNTRNLYKNL
ncbi:glycosyl transferase family 1 [Sporomusaceae bacterium FL31]|nr:glycosyl transferase family 1 [Sporomusaceae bacterium FL31]GCE33892.1 glycosyl transferase family 1 [Sporomusaceae bacterium]